MTFASRRPDAGEVLEAICAYPKLAAEAHSKIPPSGFSRRSVRGFEVALPTRFLEATLYRIQSDGAPLQDFSVEIRQRGIALAGTTADLVKSFFEHNPAWSSAQRSQIQVWMGTRAIPVARFELPSDSRPPRPAHVLWLSRLTLPSGVAVEIHASAPVHEEGAIRRFVSGIRHPLLEPDMAPSTD